MRDPLVPESVLRARHLHVEWSVLVLLRMERARMHGAALPSRCIWQRMQRDHARELRPKRPLPLPQRLEWRRVRTPRMPWGSTLLEPWHLHRGRSFGQRAMRLRGAVCRPVVRICSLPSELLATWTVCAAARRAGWPLRLQFRVARRRLLKALVQG